MPKKWVDSINASNPEYFKGDSGTIIVWANLQQQNWKTKKGLFDNVAREAGRMYRYYIHGPKNIDLKYIL